jgi:hypothetical protein
MKYCFTEEKKKKKIKMATNITTAEVKELQKQFIEKIGDYAVKFDDISLYKGYSGQDAVFSGKILLEKDYSISWSFSLVDGIKILEANFVINDKNRNILQNLQDIYQIFYEKFNQLIRDIEVDSDVEGLSDEKITMTQSSEEESSQEEEEENMSITESRLVKNRAKLINSSYERMKKLSGIK